MPRREFENISHLQFLLSNLQSQVKPKVTRNPGDPDNQLDDPSRMPSTVTLPGTCKSHMGWHKNGDEWHPIIASHGEQKCIKCRCKVSHSYLIYLLYCVMCQTLLVANQKKSTQFRSHIYIAEC